MSDDRELIYVSMPDYYGNRWLHIEHKNYAPDGPEDVTMLISVSQAGVLLRSILEAFEGDISPEILDIG